MCHSENLESKKFSEGNPNNSEALHGVDQLNASRQFMEEIDHVTARLLDNVIYDVISNGVFDNHTEAQIEASQPNMDTTNGADNVDRLDLRSNTEGSSEALVSQASQFVSSLINEVSEPVETAEYHATAQLFLSEVLDKVESLACNTELNSQVKHDNEKIDLDPCNAKCERHPLDNVSSDLPVIKKADKFVRSSGNGVNANIKTGEMKNKDFLLESAKLKTGTSGENCSESGSVQSGRASLNKQKQTSGGVMFYVDAGDQNSAVKKKPNFAKKVAKTSADSIEPGQPMTDSEDFEELIDGLVGQIIHESLTLYNPLFQFYKAGGSLDDVAIEKNPLEDSGSRSIVDSFEDVPIASRTVIKSNSVEPFSMNCNDADWYGSISKNEGMPRRPVEVVYCSSPEMILERKVFDVKRWICISRPQYKFSCGLSSVVSSFNFLYSTLGYGGLDPVTQETALDVLGFSKPYNEIKFGPFTGNNTLKRWFRQLCGHYKVRGYYYTLYKPKGCATTSISEEVALSLLKEGLQSCNTAFIYHCYNHYMCPIGFELVPEYPEHAYVDAKTISNNDEYPVNNWILIGDTSRKHSTIHSRLWEDIVLDLNCDSPHHYDIRKPYLGIFKGERPRTGPESLALRNATALENDHASPVRRVKRKRKFGNLHCIMAMTKLPPKLPKDHMKSQGSEPSDVYSSVSRTESGVDAPVDEVAGSSLSINSDKNSDVSATIEIIGTDID